VHGTPLGEEDVLSRGTGARECMMTQRLPLTDSLSLDHRLPTSSESLVSIPPSSSTCLTRSRRSTASSARSASTSSRLGLHCSTPMRSSSPPRHVPLTETRMCLCVRANSDREPVQAAEIKRRVDRVVPQEAFDALPKFKPTDAAVATRKLSQDCLNALAKHLPELLGGSADLTPSTLTELKCSHDFQFGTYDGRYIRYVALAINYIRRQSSDSDSLSLSLSCSCDR